MEHLKKLNVIEGEEGTSDNFLNQNIKRVVGSAV
jgi:hypothetical protein